MEMDGWNYYSLIELATMKQVSLDELMTETKEDGDLFYDLSPYSPEDPEQAILKRERWETLRQEVKELIDLLVDCPVEVLAEITGSRRRSCSHVLITQKRVRKYLLRLWGDEDEVDAVIDGVKEFLREGGYDETVRDPYRYNNTPDDYSI